MRILMLEDNHDVGDSMKRAFEIRGHQVDWVTTIRDAYVDLDENPDLYDFVILDYSLPDGKGTNLLPLPIPTAMFSGYMPRDAEQYAKTQGAVVFSKSGTIELLDYVESIGESK